MSAAKKPSTARIVAKLKQPQSAESLAYALGHNKGDLSWLVPTLHALKDEGKVKWEAVNEDGNFHWRAT